MINLGSVKLTLSSLTLGKGPQRVGLVLGLHGGETAGLYLLEKLSKKESQLRNRVKIIPSANPSGLLLASRYGQLDLPVNIKDPNRSFPGSEEGSVQERISTAILELVNDCDFVLDVHNFSNLGQAFAIVSLEGLSENFGQNPSDLATLNFLKSLKMNWAFWVDQKQAEQRGFRGTFNEALNQRGIPSLCLETPAIEFLSEKELESLSQKLIVAINRVGKKGEIEGRMPKLIQTKIIRSQRSGIFFPKLQPPVEVKRGTFLGTLFDPFNLETIDIQSPQDGLLVVLKRKDFVRVGEFLMEIGWEVRPKFT